MTSDENDKSNAASGEDDAPGSAKRPSRIIELEAEEVEVKPDEDEAAGEQTPGEDAGVTGSRDEAGDERPPPSSERPPQRTRPSDVKGFVTHLAAGLIGGLIGVVGAGIGLDKLPLTGFTGKSEAPGQIAQIQQRMNALDEAVKGQSSSLDGAARTAALDRLEVRLAAAEKKSEAIPAVPQDIMDRLAKLEGTLKTLVSAAGEEGATGLELSAALTARLDAMSSDLEKRIGAFHSDIAGLKKKLQELDTPRGLDTGQAVSTLSTRLEALEEKISAIAGRPAGQAPAARGPVSEGAALALAFERLRRGVDSGGAFTPQLDALVKLAPEGLDISGLASHAGTGAETKRALLRALIPVLREARMAGAKSDDDSFFGRLMSNAQSVVRVRRIGPDEGESAVAVLARMEAGMMTSDLNGVLREAKGLSGPALKTVQPWLDKARARQAIGDALDALEMSLLASLGPGVKANR